MKFHAVLNPLGFAVLLMLAGPTFAQSFRVQCPGQPGQPRFTNLHPDPATQATKDAITAAGKGATYASVFPGDIKCQHIAGSDGYATMADGNQIYLFGFAPLSGLANLENAAQLPQGTPGAYTGTKTAAEFNKRYTGPITAGDTTAVVDAAIVEPAMMMNLGVLGANIPAPMISVDEDDEFYLTLSNVGMIMRPDLFEQHTVHWHGYPNASSYFDGVPDASVAIDIAGSFTYYYTAPDAGTYFWHCHITPPEHLQMGMVGQLFVRPRQNRVSATASASTTDLRNALVNTYKYVNTNTIQGSSAGLTYDPCTVDILCSSPIPPVTTAASVPTGAQYAYNDGDASTRYDVEYPIQIHGFDPNFHFIGMTFNAEPFADMKDKYFLLNGRSYPDTANPGVISTQASDGVARPSQPLPALIQIHRSPCNSNGATPGVNGCQTRALLRISDLSVTEYSTLATVGVPMTVIGFHARMLRDMAGNNMSYQTNSITIGGGESLDVILDVSDPAYAACSSAAPCTYFLYSTNLDHLSNDAENFGGMMTEIQVL